MSDQDESLNEDLNALESALKSLAPRRSRLDRDSLIFRAGQASVPARPPRFWIATAAGLAALALGEGAMLANRPEPTVVERIVVVQAPAPPIEPEKPPEIAQAPAPQSPPRPRPMIGPGQSAYDRLTWQVLRYGLDGLPAPIKSAWTDRDPTRESSRQMIQEELRNILEPGDPS